MQPGIYFVQDKTIIVARSKNNTIFYDFFDKKDYIHTIEKSIEKVNPREVFGELEAMLWSNDLGRILDLAGAA